MESNKIKVCFIGDNPNFLGGIGIYQKNIIKYIKAKKIPLEMTLIYRGFQNKEYQIDKVNYVELNSYHPQFIREIIFNFKVLKYLKSNNFDIVNSHALWGYWMRNYKKKKNQKLIHVYHGITYNFFKNHLKRFGLIKKILYSPLLFYGYFIEKPTFKKADKIICVSEKVKRQIEELYGKRDNMFVLRTGVDLSNFKQRNKNKIKKHLNLNQESFYGLYVGRGGFWTKGLDRVVKISEEIHKLNKNFRLLVLGADKDKVKELLKKEFIVYKEEISREEIPNYYSASDIFFCMSRYEGGAPTLVVSEAMASGCLIVCSKDSEQEIIKEKENGLIIEDFGEREAKKILEILKDKNMKEKIIKNSIKTIKNISLEKWGEKYLKIILDKE